MLKIDKEYDTFGNNIYIYNVAVDMKKRYILCNNILELMICG